MLIRSTDPFREFDRITQQLLGGGTTNRPAVMPMDAWREGDRFVIEFDLPGVSPDTIDLDVERNVLTVKAERVAKNGDWQMLAPPVHMTDSHVAMQPAPVLGADTARVLERELGLSDAELESLTSARVLGGPRPEPARR